MLYVDIFFPKIESSSYCSERAGFILVQICKTLSFEWAWDLQWSFLSTSFVCFKLSYSGTFFSQKDIFCQVYINPWNSVQILYTINSDPFSYFPTLMNRSANQIYSLYNNNNKKSSTSSNIKLIFSAGHITATIFKMQLSDIAYLITISFQQTLLIIWLYGLFSVLKLMNSITFTDSYRIKGSSHEINSPVIGEPKNKYQLRLIY